jgi:vacuolar-type H+-ATPase subunit H
MPQEEVGSRIETIEARAEEIIKEAQSKASDILQKAREEAGRITSTGIYLDEAKTEGESIINAAKEEEGRIIEESRKKGSGIRASASTQVDKIAKRIIDMVTGTELK